MAVPHSPTQNQILSLLPVNELNRLAPHLELTPMPLGEVYYEAHDKLQYVYFPTTSIVSMHYITENGAQAEIAAVGKEGMLGISLFMGGPPPPSSSFRKNSYTLNHPEIELVPTEYNG